MHWLYFHTYKSELPAMQQALPAAVVPKWDVCPPGTLSSEEHADTEVMTKSSSAGGTEAETLRDFFHFLACYFPLFPMERALFEPPQHPTGIKERAKHCASPREMLLGKLMVKCPSRCEEDSGAFSNCLLPQAMTAESSTSNAHVLLDDRLLKNGLLKIALHL